MHADTRHSSLRPKRGLPAELHDRPAHYDFTQSNFGPEIPRPIRAFRYPQVAANIITAPKSANSRFFTDCYPISAVLAPVLNQIAPRCRALQRGRNLSNYAINHLGSVA